MRMSLRSKDLTGLRFGRLAPIRIIEKRTYGKTVHVVWQCHCDCGIVCSVVGQHLISGATKSCGCMSRELSKRRLSGEKHHNWRGGRSSHIGYAIILKPDHPAANKTGYVFEHRAVMEQLIGRYLDNNETVHHRNGVKNDNRPENLELWASKHPSGQRVCDLVAWAKQIIRQYEPQALS